MVVGEHTATLASESESLTLPVSEGAYRDARRILTRAAELAHGHPTGVVVLDGGAELAAHWQAQTIYRQGEATRLLDEPEWRASELAPWTTWRRPGAPVLHVAFLGQLDPGRTPLFGSDDPHREIARRLAWFEHVTGGPFVMTPGVAAHMAIRRAFRAHGPGAQPYWGVKDVRVWDDDRNGCGDLIWHRRPSRTEYELGWVHGFDLRAARLAAMGVAELAWGRLAHKAVPFDPALAGYWLIRARDVAWPGVSRRLPPLVEAARDGTAWVTTPIMKELMDRGCLPEHTDAWTAPGRRFLREIAERWDRARGAVAGAGHGGERAVKALYREGAGLFASPGGSIHRPDWYHTIMDRQRVPVMRHTARIASEHNRRPVAVHTDCLWYASAQPSHELAAAELGIKLGDGMGRFRHHSTTAAAVFWPKGER